MNGPFCSRVTSVLRSRFPLRSAPHPPLPEAGLLQGPPCCWGLCGSSNVRAQCVSGDAEWREFRVLGPQLPPGALGLVEMPQPPPPVLGAVPSSCQIKPLWVGMAPHCCHFLGVTVPPWSLTLLATRAGHCPFLQLLLLNPLAMLGSRQRSDWHRTASRRARRCDSGL